MNFEKYNGICVLLIAIMFFMPVNVLTAEQEKNRATVTLIDEGFEDGIPTDWTNTGWILNWYGFPHSGSNWVSASGSGSLLQTPSLTFGDNTQLSFWYAAESGTMSMRVEIDSDEVWSKTFSNTAYEQANVDLSSYTGTHTVSFICTSSGFYVENLDDILITTELELTPPTITNVDAQPPIQTTGGSVEITCDVTDDTGVDTVYANITYPDATTSSHVMSNAGGNSYSFSQSYNQNGIHEYHIYAIDIDGNSAESSTYTFEIDDPPTAEFTYSPSDPTTQDTVQFTDQSTDFDGSIVSWSWDFGDGASSTVQNPTHQFDDGTYTVTLTVTDDDGATDMHTDTVTVSNVGPIADFSYSPSDPTTAELVTFTDGSSDVDGSVVSWSWDFGDGGTSSQSDPTYSYSDDGTYTVTLTVTDDDGATDSYSDTVVVANIGPTAEFTYSPSDPTTQDTVQFTDQSTDFDGSIVSWSWDFGDGATSTLENPTHQFDEGTYTVILTVTDDDGATDMHTDTVTVSNVGPIADFSYSPSDPTTAELVTFTDGSSDVDGSVVSWSWDFGDGGTSSQSDPTYSYSDDGTYTVTLTVTDDDGATDSYSDTVVVANIDPTAEFTYSPSDPTTQDTVQFTDQSTDFDGSIVSWSWDFGDGATSTLENPTHSYADDGTYTVTLTVTDDDGATDTHTDTVTVSNVGPIADFSYSPTTPSTLDDVSFTDLSVDSDGSISSWSWDFDDGVTSSDQHPIHSFSTVGTYQVSLTVTDDDGATNSVTISVEITDPVDTVDINQSVFDRGFPVRNTSNGHWAGAQNFTPTVNIITSVGLYMRTFGEPSFDLIVELREDGVEGLVLDTVTFTPSEIDDSWSWLNIDFVDVPVEEGIDYFIVLKPPVNGVYDTFGYEWGFALDNQYEDGSFWYNRDPILTPYWRDLPDVYEFTFKVNGLT